MAAEINIYNPESLGAPLGQYCHVTRVKASEFLLAEVPRRWSCIDFSRFGATLLNNSL